MCAATIAFPGSLVKVFAMSVVLADINAKALELSPEDKRELILNLVTSLDCEPDADPEGIARAWDVEIARRVAQLDKGEVECIDGEEVFARVDELLRGTRV